MRNQTDPRKSDAKVLLIVYDNGSMISHFPIGIASLTAVLDAHNFDFVGLSFIGGYWQYRKALEISQAVSNSKNRCRFFYCLGGHGPSPEPEFFLKKLMQTAFASAKVKRRYWSFSKQSVQIGPLLPSREWRGEARMSGGGG